MWFSLSGAADFPSYELIMKNPSCQFIRETPFQQLRGGGRGQAEAQGSAGDGAGDGRSPVSYLFVSFECVDCFSMFRRLEFRSGEAYLYVN